MHARLRPPDMLPGSWRITRVAAMPGKKHCPCVAAHSLKHAHHEMRRPSPERAGDQNGKHPRSYGARAITIPVFQYLRQGFGEEHAECANSRSLAYASPAAPPSAVSGSSFSRICTAEGSLLHHHMTGHRFRTPIDDALHSPPCITRVGCSYRSRWAHTACTTPCRTAVHAPHLASGLQGATIICCA